MSDCCDELGRCLVCGNPTELKPFRERTKTGREIVRMIRVCVNRVCSRYYRKKG